MIDNQNNTTQTLKDFHVREDVDGYIMTEVDQLASGFPIYTMDKSWIKLYRKMQDHWVYKNPNYTNIWLAILWGTNWKQSKVLVHGKLVIVERGEILTSIRTLAQQSHTSEKSVRNFLKHAEVDGMILPKKGTAATHFIVLNYNDLQEQQSTEGHTEGTARAQQGHYHKKLRSKEGKNIEQTDSVSMRSRAFTPPSFEEVEAFFTSLFRHDLAQPYFDYYTSNGWRVGKNPMKNWQSAARNWIRNEAKYKQSQGSSNAQPRRGDRERTDTETYYEQLANIAVKSVRQRSGTDGMVHKVIGQIEQSAGLAIGAEQSRSDTGGTTLP